MRQLTVATLLAAAIVISGGCQTPAGAGKVGITGMTAFDTYRAALAELSDGDYVEAGNLFETLASATLNPVLSQLSLLRLGDALFFQSRYAEAAEIFREYQEQFSNSPDVYHAIYMRGLCFIRKMPEDSLIMPPAESREINDADNAYLVLSTLLDRAPDSYYAMRARYLLAKVVERKCRHHLYVAAFYRRDGKPMGVVQRLEQALALEDAEHSRRSVPDSFMCAAAQENILELAEAYEELGDLSGLKRTLEAYKKHQKAYKSPEDGLNTIQEAIQALDKPGPAQ